MWSRGSGHRAIDEAPWDGRSGMGVPTRSTWSRYQTTLGYGGAARHGYTMRCYLGRSATLSPSPNSLPYGPMDHIKKREARGPVRRALSVYPYPKAPIYGPVHHHCGPASPCPSVPDTSLHPAHIYGRTLMGSLRPTLSPSCVWSIPRSTTCTSIGYSRWHEPRYRHHP